MADDFTIRLGADNTALMAGLRAATQSINSFASGAKLAMAGLAGGLGLKALTKDFMDYHTNLANSIQVMGYSVSNVEAIGGAMRRFGGDTSGAISSLDSLSSMLTAVRDGKMSPLIDTAQRYGVTFMKSNGQMMNAEELLGSLTKQMRHMDVETQRAVASQLGLDAALLRVINSGNFDSLVASQKKLGLSTEEDLKIATEMESAWLDLKDTFSQIAREISRAVIPPLTKLMKWLNDLIGRVGGFKGIFQSVWGAISKVMTPVVEKMQYFWSVIQKIGEKLPIFDWLKKALDGLTPVFSFLGDVISAAFLPFELFFELIEDIIEYTTGDPKKTAIGMLVEKFPILGDAFSAVKDTFSVVGDAFNLIFGSIKEAWDYLSNMTWDKFIADIKEVGTTIANFFKGIWSDIKSGVKDMSVGFGKTLGLDKYEWFRNWAGEDKAKDAQVAQIAAPGNIPPQGVSGGTANTAGATVVNDNSTHTNNLTINTNNEKVAENAMNEQLKTGLANRQ